MRRFRFGTILLGVILILAGVVYAGNVLNIWDISIFFDGWWTLFIIIPCVVSMFDHGFTTSNILGTIIGGMLLLNAQRIVPIDIVFKLLIPVILVAIGIKILFRDSFIRKIQGVRHNDGDNINFNTTINSDGTTSSDGGLGGSVHSGEHGSNNKNAYQNNINNSQYDAFFAEQTLNYNGLPFNGTTNTVIFGSMNIDLRGSTIAQDCVIDVTCIFGGVNIIIPPNVNVKSNCLPIFGGVSNKHANVFDPNKKTIYINGTCIFGGVEVKL